MPSPPFPSAVLPSIMLPWLSGALPSTAMPSPPFALAVLFRIWFDAERSPTSMPVPSVPLALFSSMRLLLDSPSAIPSLLPDRSLPRMTVSRARSRSMPPPCASRSSLKRIWFPTESMMVMPVPRPSTMRFALDEVAVRRQQLLADRDAVEVAVQVVVGDDVVARGLHPQRVAARVRDLVVGDRVPAGLLEDDAFLEVAAEVVLRDELVPRVRVEDDADAVLAERVALDAGCRRSCRRRSGRRRRARCRPPGSARGASR